jgi:hypothetical protein
MYQPKIREALIPRLYHLAKVLDVPMTLLASVLLEMGIKYLERSLAAMGYVQPGSHPSSSDPTAQPNEMDEPGAAGGGHNTPFSRL